MHDIFSKKEFKSYNKKKNPWHYGKLSSLEKKIQGSRQNKLTILKKDSIKTKKNMEATSNYTQIVHLPRLSNKKTNKKTKQIKGIKIRLALSSQQSYVRLQWYHSLQVWRETVII